MSELLGIPVVLGDPQCKHVGKRQPNGIHVACILCGATLGAVVGDA